MKKVRRIACLCMVCCLCMLLAVPCLAATAPTDLPKDTEELFPVAGCEYEDIFLRTLYTDGAKTDAASSQLRLLFENDTEVFLTALTEMPYAIEEHVLSLLVYGYYFAEDELVWLRDQALNLQKDYDVMSPEISLLQRLRRMATAQWEERYGTTTNPSATAPTDLSKIYEEMFPVAGCEYDDIFLRTLYADGAYADAASSQLRLLFEKDSEAFITSLAETPYVIKQNVLKLLVSSCYYTEEDTLWLRNKAAELQKIYESMPTKMQVAQEIKFMADAQWEEVYGSKQESSTGEATTPTTPTPSEPSTSTPEEPAKHHYGCIIACAVLAVVIVGCTVVNVRLHKKRK